MWHRTSIRGLIVSMVWLLTSAAGITVAAEPSAESAAELVRQALRAELVGDNQIRRERLEAAATLDPKFGPAHWQLGQLQLPGEVTWRSARDMAVIPGDGDAWKSYRTMRDAYLRDPKVIWSVDEAPAPRTFRCRFELSSRPRYAEVRLAAFRNVSVAINGLEVRMDMSDGGAGLSGIQKHLRTGENTLAVFVEHGSGAAGLLAWLGCTYQDEQIHSVPTDQSWEVHAGPVEKWSTPYASDQSWSAAVSDRENSAAWENARKPLLSPRVDAALAKWCGRNSLGPQARFHWARVLEANPLDAEAIRALGLKHEDGFLWTHAEIAERRESERQAKEARKTWGSKLTALKTVVATGDGDRVEKFVDDALEEVTPSSAPVLTAAICSSQTVEFASPVVDLLCRIREPAATEGLVEAAIHADAEPVRKLALRRLQSHSGAAAASFLLPLLQLPLQIQTRQVEQSDNGLVLMANKFQYVDRRADHDVIHLEEQSVLLKPYLGHSYRVWRHKIDANGDGIVDRSDLDLMKSRIVPSINKELKASAESLARESMQSRFLAARMFADQENLRREIQNQRVFSALRETTGQSVNQRVSAWWQWWIDCNSLAMSPTRGIKMTRRTSYGIQRYEYRTAGWCCFVVGTPVWTRLGLVPIEQIHAGDEVLSQDPDTGELAYKIVTFTTIRPPSPVLTLTAGGDSVTTTLGHRFWRTGSGWIMAKQVAAGIPLHRMDGSHPLDLVVPAGDAPAYNLVVDDFHTYFVGQAGWLVHDNRLPVPGNVLLPGLLAEPGEIVDAVPGCGLHKALINAAQGQVAK